VSRRLRRWPSGFGGLEWREEDRAYASLLDALTRDRLETEVLEREISSPAGQNAPDVAKLERDELDEARRELDEFRAALTDAHSRGNEHGEVSYDSKDPRQDAAADVLIQYLVRPDYAEVRTEEPQPERYVYYIRIDWPKLRALAAQHGHQLPE